MRDGINDGARGGTSDAAKGRRSDGTIARTSNGGGSGNNGTKDGTINGARNDL